MIYLAKRYGKKELSPLKDISKAENISFNYLEKIFLELEKKGLVKGRRGPSGGYVIAKPPKKISVKSVISALEGNIQLVDCCFCKKIKGCASRNVWLKLEKALDKTLKEITLEKLIK